MLIISFSKKGYHQRLALTRLLTIYTALSKSQAENKKIFDKSLNRTYSVYMGDKTINIGELNQSSDEGGDKVLFLETVKRIADKYEGECQDMEDEYFAAIKTFLFKAVEDEQ